MLGQLEISKQKKTAFQRHLPSPLWFTVLLRGLLGDFLLILELLEWLARARC